MEEQNEVKRLKDEIKFWIPIITMVVAGVTAFVALKSSHEALAQDVVENQADCEVFQTEMNDIVKEIHTNINEIKLAQEGIKKDTEYLRKELE